MPTKIKTDKVAETITPIAQKVASDPELREHAKKIADSAMKIYTKVQSEGGAKAAASTRRCRTRSSRRWARSRPARTG